MSYNLPTDCILIIANNITEPKIELLDWIDVKKLNFNNICGIEIEHIEIFLRKHYEKINWSILSRNKYAIKLLKENIDKIFWPELSLNENGIEILKDHEDKINWFNFSLNPNPKNIEIMRKNKEKLVMKQLAYNTCEKAIDLFLEIRNGKLTNMDIHLLCGNKSEKAISIIKENINNEYLNWYSLSSNEYAIDLLKNNPHKIDFYELSFNENAYDIIKDNLNKIDYTMLSFNKNMDILNINPHLLDWSYLSFNENAIDILERNKDKIDYVNLSFNKSIFKITEKEIIVKKVSDIIDNLILSRGFIGKT